VDEHKLDRNDVDQLARDRFGRGVTQLNKLEASGLIEELFQRAGNARPGGGRNRPPQRRGRVNTTFELPLAPRLGESRPTRTSRAIR
jgi:hypothetical protein